MKSFLIVGIFLGLTLVSCGSKGYWTKPDFDSREWQRDRYQCQYNAEVACQYWNPHVGAITGTICVNNHFRDCVQARGYIWYIP